jgi:hypothetical protein
MSVLPLDLLVHLAARLAVRLRGRTRSCLDHNRAPQEDMDFYIVAL